jgi:hypothetical protein
LYGYKTWYFTWRNNTNYTVWKQSLQ